MTTEVLIGNMPDGVIRVVYYFVYADESSHGHGRGVADFHGSTLLDVLSWIEMILGFEKEKVSVIF